MTQISYVRNPAGWQGNSITQQGVTSFTSAREAGVLLHALDSFELTREPLDATWARFFPSVKSDERDTYPYPRPSDDEFWSIYAEPIDEFFNAATAFAEALMTIAKGPAQADDAAGCLAYPLALGRLDTLAAHLREIHVPVDNGRVQRRWVAPTLLASLAKSALLDLDGDWDFRICETCGRFFVSSAYQARYCSERCRHTMNKRVYRRSLRTAAKPKRRGKRGTS